MHLDPSVVDKHQCTALPDSEVQLVLLCSMPYKLAWRAVSDTLQPTRQTVMTKMRLVKHLRGLLLFAVYLCFN